MVALKHHVALQAHPSWQAQSKAPKGICTDKNIGTRKGIELSVIKTDFNCGDLITL